MIMLPLFIGLSFMTENRTGLWTDIASRLMSEYRHLSRKERLWIDDQLDRIELIQAELDRLFSLVEGERHCRYCRGDCCTNGHNHMTLVNLLSFARHGTPLPAADFSCACPFLDPQGCKLPVSGRPYNCITFICDRIEDALAPDQQQQFYALDQQLRELYLSVCRRYRGAAMTGLMIQEQRRPGQSFLEVDENHL